MLDNIFDNYSRQARLYPALISLAPAFGSAVAHSNILKYNWSHAAWLVLIAASLFLLADIARRKGKILEKRLLSDWEYFPSVTLLRHRDETLNAIQTKRYHQLANSVIEEIQIPTVDTENAAPSKADAVYETISNSLLTNTRDQKRFPLLFKENINYGFRRNLLGLKSISLFITFSVLVIELFLSWDQITLWQLPDATSIFIVGGCILLVTLWAFYITQDFVKTAAVDYGKQLLQSLEILSSKKYNQSD